MPHRFDLTGRVAVVTGASSGLGAEVARSLASAGAQVALVARRQDRLEALAGETGGRSFPCDLLDDAQLRGLIAQVSGTMGPPGILVSAAGDIFSRDRAEAEPVEAIRRTLDLNLVAPFRLCQDVFPLMAAAGRGSIVHVTSISGRVGIRGFPQASYAASKQGLSGLTAELAVQWAEHGIRVNCVAPGFFRSEINQELYQDEQFRQWLADNTPLPGHATFDDFTGAIHWLVSDAARHVTGQTIVIDGGWTIQ
jgi:NAD(P)-dependent dehydrogenase (short-subunit alcohol dehydrogenase family)